VEHIAGALAEDFGRLCLDGLRIEKVNLPATHVSTLRQHLAVHDRVGPGRIRQATLDGDVVREVGRPGSQRHRDDWFGQRGGDLLQRRGCSADARTSATILAAAASPRGLASCSIGAAGIPGSISSIRRRSTTTWPADAVTATAQPR
jgi:hypothetical protein